MTQEDKELLLKDLCARLPYGVKVQHQRQDYLDEIQTIEHITRKYGEIETESVLGFVDDFKPYLRPMSSMTKEENKKYYDLCDTAEVGYYEFGELFSGFDNYDTVESIDYLNSIHVDYRGLIPKGLAIEVTKENNPYKK